MNKYWIWFSRINKIGAKLRIIHQTLVFLRSNLLQKEYDENIILRTAKRGRRLYY